MLFFECCVAWRHPFFFSVLSLWENILCIQGPTTCGSIFRLFVLMVVSTTKPIWRNTTPGIISQQTSEYGKMSLTWRRVEVDKSTSTISMRWAFNKSLLCWKAWNMWKFWTLGRMFSWAIFCWLVSCWIGGFLTFQSTFCTFKWIYWIYVCLDRLEVLLFFKHVTYPRVHVKHPRIPWDLTRMVLKSWLYCCLQMNGKINSSCWTSSVAKIW